MIGNLYYFFSIRNGNHDTCYRSSRFTTDTFFFQPDKDVDGNEEELGAGPKGKPGYATWPQHDAWAETFVIRDE